MSIRCQTVGFRLRSNCHLVSIPIYQATIKKGETKLAPPLYLFWYARQDSNPPTADFAWRLNLLLGPNQAFIQNKTGIRRS